MPTNDGAGRRAVELMSCFPIVGDQVIVSSWLGLCWLAQGGACHQQLHKVATVSSLVRCRLERWYRALKECQGLVVCSFHPGSILVSILVA